MNMILDQACLFLSRELHEISEIREIVVNPNFTGVLLENDDMGMAMNIRKGPGNDSETPITAIEVLIGLDGLSGLERLAKAADPLMLSIKVALINALSKPFMTKDYLEARGYRTAQGRDNYSIKEMVKDQTVVIVGFGGNVTKIASRGEKVFVYGVTAGFFPEPLFDMGVDAIATSIVTDSSGMMDALKNCGPMVERFFSESCQELFIQKKL